MRYLLDTHILIWIFDDFSKIPTKILDLIHNKEIQLYVCSVSLWEIAIKVNIGKLKMNLSFDELLIQVRDSAFIVLHTEDEHLREVAKLPLLHRDPFGRLIVSTAIAEDLTILTKDENIQKYDVSWIW